MKKFLAVILSVILLGAAVPPSAAAAGFRDVKQNAWYADAVQYVSSQGLMAGTGSGFFRPNQFTTRGQLVTILYKMAGSPYVSASSPFSDISPRDYFYKAVLWASSAGVVSGKGKGRFCPNDAVKRQEAVAILYQYSKLQGYSTRQRCKLYGFSDSRLVQNYFQDAVKWACATQLITGTSTRALAPNSATTRAQTAVMLTKYCRTMRNSTFDDAARRWDRYIVSDLFLRQLGLRSDLPSLQYTIADLNGDSVPELVIREPAFDTSYEWTNNWIAVLQGGGAQLAGGKFETAMDMKWTDKFHGYGNIYYLPKENAIHMPSFFRSTANMSMSAFYKLSGTTLTFSFDLGHDKFNTKSEYFLTTPSGTKPMSHAAWSKYTDGAISFEWTEITVRR